MTEDGSRISVQLQNFNVLQHLDEKLYHLPVNAREAVTKLVREYSLMCHVEAPLFVMMLM